MVRCDAPAFTLFGLSLAGYNVLPVWFWPDWLYIKPKAKRAVHERPQKTRKLAEMIRVDHAGEHGAVRIYDGQKAVFDKIKGKENVAELVAHMADARAGTFGLF